MTSPAQLNYLDAMGIPVWVSRDRVAYLDGNTELQDNTDGDADSNANHLPASSATALSPTESSSLQQPANAKAPHPLPPTKQKNPQSGQKSAAQSLLDSLASDAPQTRRQNTNETPQEAAVPPNPNTTEPVAEAPIKSPSPAALAKVTSNEQNKAVSPNNDALVYQNSQYYLFANGNRQADWLVVGHSPESFNGIGQEPFAAESGTLLENMLKAVGISAPRQQAYFINAVNVAQVNDHQQQSNMQQNSAQQSEATQLHNKIVALIEEVQPKMVLIVGQIAAQYLLNTDQPLITMRAKLYQLTAHNIPCVVTYYPSYLLQKPTDKGRAWQDLKLAMSAL